MNYLCESFKPVRLVVLLIIAALLGGSYFYPSGNLIWREISLSFFHISNGSLTLSEFWALIVALSNTDNFNIVGAIVMALPTLAYVYFDKSVSVEERLSRFGLMWLGVICFTVLSKHGVPTIDHKSPSLVVENFNNINDLVPEVNAKYKSSHSFPGDHGVSAMATIAMAVLLLDKRYAWPVSVMAVLYAAPRLFSGAHWLSDVIVGGGVAFLVSFAIVSSFPTLIWSRALTRKLLEYRLIRKMITVLRIT